MKNRAPVNDKKNKKINNTGDKNRTKVVIMGQEYVVRGGGSGDEIRRLAGYVDRMMQETRRRCPNLPVNKLAVLTSLNLCDELFQIKHEYESLIQTLEEEQKK